jgi:hypothetical protein
MAMYHKGEKEKYVRDLEFNDAYLLIEKKYYEPVTYKEVLIRENKTSTST